MNSSQKFDHYYELMERAIRLQGLRPKTMEAYLRTIRRVNDRINKDLDELTPEDLKSYFAGLLDTHSWSTVKIDRCALVFFYTHVLERDWQWIKIVKVRPYKRLPDILSQKEVAMVLGNLEKMRYRVCLTVIYSMGLRISEALRIQPGDICSERMLLHVRDAKGNKDRFVPLPHLSLHLMRKFWATHRNPNFLFPKFSGTQKRISRTKFHMDKGGVQSALKAALLDSNISKKITVHSLRHSYATHLVESGLNLRMIQEILGHASPATTAIYTQLSKPVVQDSEKIINLLMQILRRML